MKDLRYFLNWMRQEHPQDLIEIDREVDSRYEITAVLLKLHKLRLEDLPVLVFKRVRTTKGEISPYPVIINIAGSRRRYAKWLEATPETVTNVARERMTTGRKNPVVIPRGEAPCKETVKLGKEVDLFELPALVEWKYNPGPYINAGGFLCYDPDTHVENSAIIRGWIKSRDTIPHHANHHGHTAHIRRLHEARNKDMRAVFWVGHHPAAMKGSATRIPYGESHFQAMGGLIGEPLRLVPSETLGDDFLVPADAEFVIEGIVPAHQRSPEGPYGEDWGHVGAQRLHPFLKVTAMTHRRDAYWVNFVTGQSPFMIDRREGTYRADIGLRVARMVSPAVLEVRESAIKGGFYVRIKKSRQGEAKDIGLAVLSSIDGAKFAMIFDEDVDINDDAEALWALGSRTQWDDDVTIIAGARGGATDPSTPQEGVSAKALIDATTPPNFEPRNSIPKEVLDRVRLNNYLPGQFFDSLPQRLFSQLPENLLREIGVVK